MLEFLVLAIGSVTLADEPNSRMAGLYERVCLNAFPDDNTVAAIMAAEGARELTAKEVKVTMVDDPARGWALPDGKATVWIEFPPFHACSVRWNSPEVGNLSAYRGVADSHEKAVGGFRPIAAYDSDSGPIHIHAIGEQRTLPDHSSESLFVFDQYVTDPKRRAAGETGFSLRFVHQYAPAAAPAGK